MTETGNFPYTRTMTTMWLSEVTNGTVCVTALTAHLNFKLIVT